MSPLLDQKREDIKPNSNTNSLINNGNNTYERNVTFKDSPLTDFKKDKNFRSLSILFNCSFAMLIVYTGIHYFEHPKLFWRHMLGVWWSFSNIQFFAIKWMSFQLWALLIFAGCNAWMSIRSKIKEQVVDFVFLFLYGTSLTLMVIACPLSVLNDTIRPAINIALAAEHVRIIMKVHSFLRETVSIVLKKSLKDDQVSKHRHPGLKHYFYFLFAPTFIYKESYKRRPKISFAFIFHNLVRFLKGFIICYYIFTFLFTDHFQNTGKQPFSVSQALKMAIVSMFGGITLFLMSNYLLLHAWVNMFAEAMQFGDRVFYHDWWNSMSLPDFFRKWNKVVNEWIHTYIYMDLIKMGFSKVASGLFSFLLSAVVHELVLVQCVGFFYPILPTMFVLSGAFSMLFANKKKTQFWNYFLLINLPVGTGICLFIYTLEFFARVNCPRTMDPVSDFFIPRSWGQSCKIFAFL